MRLPVAPGLSPGALVVSVRPPVAPGLGPGASGIMDSWGRGSSVSLAVWVCVPVAPVTFQLPLSAIAPGLGPGALEAVASALVWPPVASGLSPDAPGVAVRWCGSADCSGLGPDGGGGERCVSCSMVLPTPSRHARLLTMPRCFWIPARRRQRERVRGVGMNCWRRTASESDDRLPPTSESLPPGGSAKNEESISILFRVFFVFVLLYFGSVHGTLAGAASARWPVLAG